MTCKKLLIAAGALAVAVLVGAAELPQAQAAGCGQANNDVTVEFYGGGRDTFCKIINHDMTVENASSRTYGAPSKSIKKATLATKGETGTCDLYLITWSNEYHKKFNLGDWERQSVSVARGVYKGFRLGC